MRAGCITNIARVAAYGTTVIHKLAPPSRSNRRVRRGDDAFVYGVKAASGAPARKTSSRQSYPKIVRASTRRSSSHLPGQARRQFCSYLPAGGGRDPKTASEKPLERLLIEMLERTGTKPTSNPER